MEMASARRPRARQSDQIVLWGACVLLSALSLLGLLVVSSCFGAARFTLAAGEISVLVRTTSSSTAVDDDVVAAQHCGVDDDGDDNRMLNLLERLRNRRLVFVGDSIGRNQWESMLCMLASAVADADADKPDSIYEENGSLITKHKGALSFRFVDYNCTVEHYRSPYLVRRRRPPRRAPRHVRSTLQLAAMDSRAHQWRDADILVFNTGHWWSLERLQQLHCYFQEGKKLRLDMSVQAAYQRAMSTLNTWVHREVSANKTLVIFRTYSPAHTRAATNSGSCGMETLPELNSSRISLRQWWPGRVNPAFEPPKSGSTSAKLHVLNVTVMAAQRRDGHPSVYNVAPASRMPAPAGQRADCSHWCLPGVPDSWNELLYAAILRRFS
ncbi:hypothetical protein ABZP36_001283 [Zizania latifolia]